MLPKSMRVKFWQLLVMVAMFLGFMYLIFGTSFLDVVAELSEGLL